MVSLLSMVTEPLCLRPLAWKLTILQEDQDLSSNTTAHIAYGGSYAGAYVAFLRKLYPDVYW